MLPEYFSRLSIDVHGVLHLGVSVGEVADCSVDVAGKEGVGTALVGFFCGGGFPAEGVIACLGINHCQVNKLQAQSMVPFIQSFLCSGFHICIGSDELGKAHHLFKINFSGFESLE